MPVSAKINYAASIFNLALFVVTGGTAVACVAFAGVSFCLGSYYWMKHG